MASTDFDAMLLSPLEGVGISNGQLLLRRRGGSLQVSDDAGATWINLGNRVVAQAQGAVGDETNNNMAGKSAVALGASACVVTNSNVVATDVILVTPLSTDATLVTWKAVASAGSFTVTGGAAAAADWSFQWAVVKVAV